MKSLSILGLLVLLAVSSSGEPEWWKTMTLYQIYPRSFKDSNGDGVGDLKGIQSGLQHLANMNITAFWLSPVYLSPMVDFGYDIKDFKDIDPIFGTMEDFDNLLKEAHRLGIKVIMDFVPNHTSEEHEWFQKSVKKIDPYTDFYMWHEGKIVNGTRQPPNNWVSVLYGPSWTWNEERQEWYYHHFVPEQPDLNLRNPKVVKEINEILRFWLNKGVDGFRIDAIADLFEVPDFRDEPLTGLTNDPLNFSYVYHDYSNNLPEIHDLLKVWRNLLDEYDERIIAVEIYGNISMVTKYFEYPATFPLNYEIIDTMRNYSTPEDFKEIIDNWLNHVPDGVNPNWGAGNHDRSRLFSLFGRDFGHAVQIITQLLPGISIVYYGEELGLENTFYTFEETVDPKGCMQGPEKYAAESRDEFRAPFPWDNSTNAGFSNSSKPWLPVDKKYPTINLEYQKAAENSPYKNFMKVRKIREWPAVKKGSVQVEILGDVLAFSRTLKNERSVYVLVNFAQESQLVNLNSFSGAPAEVELYHATGDAGLALGQKVKSDALRVLPRGAAIYVSP